MVQDYGLRISQPGHDVKYCPDEKCVFTSKNNTLKIAKQGVLSLVIPAGKVYADGAYNVTLAHELGFSPAFIVNPNDGTTAGTMTMHRAARSMNQACSIKLIDNLIVEFTIDATTLTCYARPINADSNICASPYWPQGADKTVYFKYFLFTQALE